MTKRRRTQQDQAQWQAQRDERMSTLMQQLEAGVEAIQTSEDFQRYLRTAATFHHYSPNNVLLILSQRPDATRVAGYRAWQALGRQVKKGEKAISIFAPRPYRVTTEDETGEEQTREGEILRCPWHGWEFDITTGRSIVNSHRTRVKTYEVTVEPEDEGVDTYPVTVEDGVLVLHV